MEYCRLVNNLYEEVQNSRNFRSLSSINFGFYPKVMQLTRPKVRIQGAE